jgi:D-lactate dehydrogenase
MTRDTLIENLKNIVGNRHCLTEKGKTERYRKGFRSGEGEAVAVVVPGTLVEMWRFWKPLLQPIASPSCRPQTPD